MCNASKRFLVYVASGRLDLCDPGTGTVGWKCPLPPDLNNYTRIHKLPAYEAKYFQFENEFVILREIALKRHKTQPILSHTVTVHYKPLLYSITVLQQYCSSHYASYHVVAS